MRCHDSRLQVLLTADEDSVEFESASSHVEGCSICQQRLLEISGNDGLLRDIRETLQGCTESDDYESTGTSSVVISVESGLLDDIGAECEPVSLDFLSPPGHPEMLGAHRSLRSRTHHRFRRHGHCTERLRY